MASANYQLSREATADLRSIARYTLKKWGIEQARTYEAQLKTCFGHIADRKLAPRRPIPSRSDLFHMRCQHHHIFYTHPKDKPPLILAVLHERMDLMARLKKRLS